MSSEAMTFWSLVGVVFIVGGIVALVQYFAQHDTYPATAAEALDEACPVKPFTGDDAVALIATGDGPAVVAGDALDDSRLVGELLDAYARYRTGEDIYAGAPKEWA